MREVAILSAVRTADRARAHAACSRTPAPTIWRPCVVTRGAAPRRGRAGDHRGRRPRLRAPRGRAGPERRPPGRLPRRPARRGPGDDHQPLLLVGPAGRLDRRRSHRGRRHRRGARGRPRVDVADPDGRRQDRAQPGGGRAVPRRRTSRWATRPRTSPASSASAAATRTRSRSPATRRRWRRRSAATSPPRSCR